MLPLLSFVLFTRPLTQEYQLLCDSSFFSLFPAIRSSSFPPANQLFACIYMQGTIYFAQANVNCEENTWALETLNKCSPQREIIILDRNKCSIWGNICTARCHKTCYSAFLMLESATSGSGTHQRLCLPSILQADSSLIRPHSKPVRKHVATQVGCQTPENLPRWEKVCMRIVRAQSKCLPPCKNGCRYTRLRFSGNLHGVLDSTFSIYLAGNKSHEVSFHTSITLSKILCYNNKRCFHEKPGELDRQAPASGELTEEDP